MHNKPVRYRSCYTTASQFYEIVLHSSDIHFALFGWSLLLVSKEFAFKHIVFFYILVFMFCLNYKSLSYRVIFVDEEHYIQAGRQHTGNIGGAHGHALTLACPRPLTNAQ